MFDPSFGRALTEEESDAAADLGLRRPHRPGESDREIMKLYADSGSVTDCQELDSQWKDVADTTSIWLSTRYSEFVTMLPPSPLGGSTVRFSHYGVVKVACAVLTTVRCVWSKRR